MSGFRCPLKSNALATTQQSQQVHVSVDSVNVKTQQDSQASSVATSSSSVSEAPPVKKARLPFQSPLKSTPLQQDKPGVSSIQRPDSEKDELPSRAFKVFWTNYSKKKHKTFSDGVLVLNGVSAQLLNEEGKEIAKCKNMGRSNVESLVPGNTLLIQGKELEINQQIPFEEFSSGRVFMARHRS